MTDAQNNHIEHSLDRLHTDITALRAELAARDAAWHTRLEAKADATTTRDRLEQLEEADRKIYRLALKVAIGCGLAGAAGAGVLDVAGMLVG